MQDYMNQFLQEISSDIGLIKADYKTYIRDIKKDVSATGERVDNLERTVDARSEDQEMLRRRVTALEEQHIDLQTREEDLENRSWSNNIYIQRVPKGVEGSDIMTFTADAPPPVLDRVHQGGLSPGPSRGDPQNPDTYTLLYRKKGHPPCFQEES
ncbi:hypothetical protein NDU88_001201 [Pleurodeles waltl]|uniref:Uncharacterized protein n=1 Tax=Pleurodeles waltl TaxID=8319 RepID=A0AAV7R6D9_PLEWA|nr:hypothetical protein NDU88_001201 [Pleurodeles waltl]